jgi:hypothetical protein
MSNVIFTAFEFVPIAIFSAIFFFMALFIKYTNRLTIRSVGSDICLGALFIQITLLAMPVWMSGEVSINIAAHMAVTVIALLIWIISVWLLKRRKPSRIRSANIYQKFIDYLKKQSNIRESLSYVLGAFTITASLMMVLDFISLKPATWNLQAVRIVLLVPCSVIIGMAGYYVYRYLQKEQLNQTFERFYKEITRDNILITVQSTGTRKYDRDPTQPIVDIIRGSIMRGVLGPSIFGLEILKNSCIELLTTSGMRRKSLDKVTSHFISQIDEIGKLSLKMDEDESAAGSIRIIGEIGECAISRGIEVPVEDILRRLFEYYDVLQLRGYEIMKMTIIDAISRIGSAAAAHGIGSIPPRSGDMLGTIGASAVRDKDRSVIKEISTALYDIGKESASNSLESSVKQTALKLRDIGVSAVQNDMAEEANQIVSYLEVQGTIAASNKLELGTEQAIWSIKDIGVAYGYQHMETGINAAVGALGNIGMESSSRKLDDAVDQALWSLKEVSRYAIADGLDSSIKQSARSFARLAIPEEDKVTATVKDIRKYFDADEAKRFSKFEQEYISALKAAGTN